MKKIILNLILLLTINTYGQETLKKFEGIWTSKNTKFITVFTHNSDGDFLTIYTFSFASNALVEEHITKIKKEIVYTKTVNPENKWKVKVEYRWIKENELIAIFKGDANVTLKYKKAGLAINH